MFLRESVSRAVARNEEGLKRFGEGFAPINPSRPDVVGVAETVYTDLAPRLGRNPIPRHHNGVPASFTSPATRGGWS